MKRNAGWQGHVFRDKVCNDLFIVVYHGKNNVIYKRFEISSSGNVEINVEDLCCTVENFTRKKEPTGLRYAE